MIKSSAFINKVRTPRKYSYEGENIFSPLARKDPPEGYNFFCIFIDNCDVSVNPWNYCLVYNHY